MQKLIELKKDDRLLVSSQVEGFLKPDFVYLPVENKTILVHQNDQVKMGDEVIDGVLSPISGVVHSLQKKDSYHFAGYFLEIQNDFEEQRQQERGIKRKLTKESVLSMLALEGKKNLVLNAIDDEIYVSTENFYLFCHYEHFLELLDEIAQLFVLDRVYVCLKASSSENINQLMSDLGMYPNIILKVVPDLYLLGKTRFLLSYLGLDEEDTLVVMASQFYQIYNLLKRGRTLNDQLITISGDAIKNPMIVQVKIGSLLSDVVKELIQFKEEDVLYFANGLMVGKEIVLDHFVVTPGLSSLLIMKKKKTVKAEKCLNCGLCREICPVRLNPKLFSNAKYLRKVKDQCLKCGLCSYICPVYINFNVYLEGENHE